MPVFATCTKELEPESEQGEEETSIVAPHTSTVGSKKRRQTHWLEELDTNMLGH